MNILEELITIVSKHKIRATELLGHPENRKNGSNYQKLYEAIAEEKFKTEEEYAQYIYGKETDAKNPEFKRLKNNLKKRLINHVFLIDVKQPEFSDQYQALFTTWKYLAAARLVETKSAKNAAIDLAKKAYHYAVKYDLTELTVELGRMLKRYYGISLGDKKKFREMQQIVQKFNKIQTAELLAEDYYQSLLVEYVKSKATKEHIYEIAGRYVNELQVYAEKYKSYFLQVYYYGIKTIQYMSIHDYATTLVICKEAIEYFEKRPYLALRALAINYHKILACHTQLGNYLEAEKAAQISLKYLDAGSTNWFINLDLHFVLLMHTEQYTEAYLIYIKATQHRNFKHLFPARKEKWKIYEAYLEFLITKKLIDVSTLPKKKKFRLGRFLNETPLFARDKRGMNIPILILQIAFLVLQKKHVEVFEKIQAIEKYTTRNLKRDDTFRSNCFIRMLMQLPKAHYQQSKVIKKTKNWKKKLSSMPIKLAGQAHELEVLPYERTWRFMVEELGEAVQ